MQRENKMCSSMLHYLGRNNQIAALKLIIVQLIMKSGYLKISMCALDENRKVEEFFEGWTLKIYFY